MSQSSKSKNSSLFEADPVLGQFVAHFPSQRGRLLVQGAVVYGVITLVVQVAFANLDNDTASIVIIGVLTVAALAIFWYITHLWNREVVLYEKGLSYREGSNTAFIHYQDVVSLRQRAEKVRYFGFIPRNIYRYTIRTDLGEVLSLHNLYKNIDELGVRLEQAVRQARRPIVNTTLARGGRVRFSDSLEVGADGLYADGRELAWDGVKGYRIQNRQLVIASADDPAWYRVPLVEIDTIILLIDLLREHGVMPPDAKREGETK